MAYMRGFTERGIDFDAAMGTFTLLPGAPEESEKWLDTNFVRTDDGWKLRQPGRVERALSVGKAVFSGFATPEVVERRKLSCFGDASTPACVGLVKTTTGNYCSICKCGRWMLSNLKGDFAPKLGWASLDCPLKRPGFSNEAKS